MSQITTTGLGPLLEELYKQHVKPWRPLDRAVDARAIDLAQKKIARVHKKRQAAERRKKQAPSAKAGKKERGREPCASEQMIEVLLENYSFKDLNRVIRDARKKPVAALSIIRFSNPELLGVVLDHRGEARKQLGEDKSEVEGKRGFVDDPYQLARSRLWPELGVIREEVFADDRGHPFDDYMGRRVTGAHDPADDEIHAEIVRLSKGPFPQRLVNDLLAYCKEKEHVFDLEEWGLSAFSSGASGASPGGPVEGELSPLMSKAEIARRYFQEEDVRSRKLPKSFPLVKGAGRRWHVDLSKIDKDARRRILTPYKPTM